MTRGVVCLLVTPKYGRGGYLQWHEWARVQYAKGLRQRYCRACAKWHFPQERCEVKP